MDIKISELIEDRLRRAGKQYFANDNISEHISPMEMIALQEEVEEAVKHVLKALVIDIDHDHNTKETAKRVAKMFLFEIFNGRYREQPKITTFPNASYTGLYVNGPISIRSTCAHHLQNIVGNCWIGVVPGQEVIGLSKFNRIVHHIAERPQIQEEMTSMIANELEDIAKTKDVAVVVKAEHFCLTHRGVREHQSDMTTAEMRGGFKNDPTLRKEFYDICWSMKGHKS